MPRPKPNLMARKYKLTEEERRYMLYGESPDPDGRLPLHFQERSWPNAAIHGVLTWRELWEAHGEELTEEFVNDNPGCRPPIWWSFSAPELRRQLAGGGVPAWTVPERSGETRKLMQYGFELLWVEDHEEAPVVESEAAYLKRLGLLLPGELERLTDADFEPEVFATDLPPSDFEHVIYFK